MRSGDEDGYPEDLEVPSDEEYGGAPASTEKEKDSPKKPQSTKAHPDVPFFNVARLNKTIEDMKDRCMYPVRVISNLVTPNRVHAPSRNHPQCDRSPAVPVTCPMRPPGTTLQYVCIPL